MYVKGKRKVKNTEIVKTEFKNEWKREKLK